MTKRRGLGDSEKPEKAEKRVQGTTSKKRRPKAPKGSVPEGQPGRSALLPFGRFFWRSLTVPKAPKRRPSVKIESAKTDPQLNGKNKIISVSHVSVKVCHSYAFVLVRADDCRLQTNYLTTLALK